MQWDLGAGLSVAAMVIPQGMSYANLAGLPQVYGLYGAFVPCLVYSVLGTSRQLVRCDLASLCASCCPWAAQQAGCSRFLARFLSRAYSRTCAPALCRRWAPWP